MTARITDFSRMIAAYAVTLAALGVLLASSVQ
jgi:hypothetical protein